SEDGGLQGLCGHKGAHGPGGRWGRVHALSARPPGRGGHGRGAGERKVHCLGAGEKQTLCPGSRYGFPATTMIGDAHMDAKKVILAYSGGLDTSVILKWLQDEFGY